MSSKGLPRMVLSGFSIMFCGAGFAGLGIVGCGCGCGCGCGFGFV
jgi:hypothetical protein